MRLSSLSLLFAAACCLPIVSPCAIAAHPGEAIYSTACADCHGAGGSGVKEKNGPTLHGVDWVIADSDRLIRVALGGLALRIPLGNGTHYGAMPGYKNQLNDQQITDVLSYIRESWGNKAAPIEISRVAALRSEASARTALWTAADFGLKAQAKLGPNGEALEPLDPFAAAGFRMYQVTCQNCHQANGRGLGVGDGHGYPPLDGSEYATGSTERLIRIVIGGLQGKMVINGQTFLGVSEIMPPWQGALNDEQVAQVLTFIRQAWTNHASPVSAEMVRVIRPRMQGHPGMWKIEEIEANARIGIPQQ